MLPDGLRGLNPCLTFHETHTRELGSFDHARTAGFEHLPVVVKSYFSKPSVLHGSYFLKRHFGEQSGEYRNKTGVKGLKTVLLRSFRPGWFECPRSAKLYVARPHLRITGPPLRGNTLSEKIRRGPDRVGAIFVFENLSPSAGGDTASRNYECKYS
jgi:hypothetical protein